MATVWLAMHVITHKLVALKILRPTLAVDVECRLRFLREARAASTVRHLNVVDVHDVVELEDGTPVMVMEYLDGESLEARLAQHGKLALAETVDLLLPVCSALGAAHAAGVIHRDLKPANIFLARALTGDARSGPLVKVLDFGLARIMSDVAGRLTKTGTVVGTPRYMAPEQLFGDKNVDSRADIWALGVLLYECLSGSHPVPGGSFGQIIKSLTTQTIESLGAVCLELPHDVTRLVDRTLSIEPADRPGVRDVQSVLERHATRTPTSEETDATVEQKRPLPQWILDEHARRQK